MSEDIARSATEPKKRYTSARAQMGRVITEDDWNDGARIAEEDKRRERLDLIGAAGSPDLGFQISAALVNSKGDLDFEIAPGTLYLGGLRLEAYDQESYAQQQDWLNQPRSERAAPAAPRRDLVYLEAWQQSVEAVEDSELFEAALCGPDTSTRVRNMRRVRVAAGVTGADCGDAWQSLVAGWTGSNLGTWDPATAELVVDAELTVSFDTTGTPRDLCTPHSTGGYLGAENQAIRVQLVDGSHFTWGFDNGSPLYRVVFDVTATPTATITLQTEPKDQAHWPQAGQIIEILPWSAVLSNGEKLAELSGALFTVLTAYDPDTHQLTLTTSVPNGFGTDWLTRADLTGAAPYYFMRVWNRGDDLTSPPAIPFAPATPVSLGHTGLLVSFSGTQFVAGDHWIIGARPETPNRVVPWQLEMKRGPHGVRRFYAPLGVIDWDATQVGTVADDCRPIFTPLTRQRGCCTYTVGDGKTSFGQFSVIQDAIDRLPAEGGCICLLPGVYEQDFVVFGRRNIKVEGCGVRTRVLGAANSVLTAVIIVADSQDITLRSFQVENVQRIDVLLGDVAASELVGPRIGWSSAIASGGRAFADRNSDPARLLLPRQPLRGVHLEHLTFLATEASAIYGIGGTEITIAECEVSVRPLLGVFASANTAGRWPAIFIACDDVLIERNRVQALVGFLFSQIGMGGIQIGGGSERVEIRRNHIEGGTGNGITLGSIVLVTNERVTPTNAADYGNFARSWVSLAPGWRLVIDDRGCVKWAPEPPVHEGDPLPIPAGPLDDIRIVDNLIENMGASGIAVAHFFDLSKHSQVITVDHLLIAENRIRHCLQLELVEVSFPLREYSAYGAIALADGEIIVIRDNEIERNGTSHVDPVCGVFVLYARGLSVENNRIIDNAPRVDSDLLARPGWRGGIVVVQAWPSFDLMVIGLSRLISRQTGIPAARIHDNIVVVPEGRALVLLGLGAFSVVRNQLTTRGTATANRLLSGNAPMLQEKLDRLGGASVFVFNLGIAPELGLTPLKLATMGKVLPGATASPAEPVGEGISASGSVLFADNQVTLDLLQSQNHPVLCSVCIASLDDIGIEDNQLVCAIAPDDTVSFNLLALSVSLRVQTNRLQEPLPRSIVSALAFAPMCNASHNQSTHCLFAVGNLNLTVADGNRALVQAQNANGCQPPNNIAALMAQFFGP